MKTRLFKRVPSGNSDFRNIITQNYAYIDKTRFIKELENEDNRNHFFIRPRKFGKTLFINTLRAYYNINGKDEFDQLFGDLYIGKHPTPERNSYAILKFDFSGLNTFDEESFQKDFSLTVQNAVCRFFNEYKHIIPNIESMIQWIKDNNLGIGALTAAFDAVFIEKIQIYLIIDEYDHFANDLIAMGTRAGNDFYKTMVRANGLVRDFYERIKTATSDSIVYRTFITGISPVMLDDLTSGYNIAKILTLNPKYNEMMGFTHAEVEVLMEKTGVNPALIDVDIEAYYNGYLFHEDAANRMYNPEMIIYFFEQILTLGKMPKNIVGMNMKTDYERMKRLVKNEKNRDTVLQIMKDGSIVSEILEKFSIDMIDDDSYFLSLLFYMGMLTIKASHHLLLELSIPNYSVQTMYWEYLANAAKETSPQITISVEKLEKAISGMAMDGDVYLFIDYISKNAFSKLSDYDLRQFDEKYIKILMLAYLFMNKIYVAMSEYETVPGRADIFLQRNSLLPDIKYEWIFELKYCKASATENDIAVKRNTGLEQLKQYINSSRMKDRPNLRAVLIIFIGKDQFEIQEIQ